MADGCTAGGTREATVGDECHAVTQTGAHDGRGRVEHFAHSRTTLGTFVADHDHFARVDLTAVNGVQSVFFTVENAGFAAVGHHFGSNGSAFDHRAFGSEVAL